MRVLKAIGNGCVKSLELMMTHYYNFVGIRNVDYEEARAMSQTDVVRDHPPDRIRLRRLAAIEWRKPERAKRYLAALKAELCEAIGRWEVIDIAGLRIAVFEEPGREFYAIIHDHPKAGMSLELTSVYFDGKRFTATDAPQPTSSRPPWQKTIYLPKTAPRELVQRFLAERPPREIQPTDAEGFADEFCQNYARELAWRSRKSAG